MIFSLIIVDFLQIYTSPQHTNDFESCLDDVGIQFVTMCIEAIESRGL